MSSNNIKIKVKFGVNEVEIESPLESIRDAVDVVPTIVKNLGSSIKTAENVRGALSEQVSALEAKVQVDMPEIKIDKGDSLSDMVVKMFKDSWGRKPRRLSDVRQALDTYGLSYPKQSVAVTLMRLAQNSKLRRFKSDNGEFVYTAASTLSANEQQVVRDIEVRDAAEGE